MSKGEAMQSAWNKKLSLQANAQPNTIKPTLQTTTATTPKSATAVQQNGKTKSSSENKNDVKLDTSTNKASKSPVPTPTNTKSTTEPKSTESKQATVKPTETKNAAEKDKSTDELLHLYTGLRGTLVLVQTINHAVYEGLFHTIETQQSNNITHTVIVLQHAQQLQQQQTAQPHSSKQLPEVVQLQTYSEIQRIKFDEIIQIKSLSNPFSIDTVNNGRHSENNTFQTDTQISSKQQTRQRELQQYDFSTDNNTAAQFRSLDEEIRSNKNSTSFDQFERFQQMTGKTDTFDLNSYSTQLDKSSDVYKRNIQYASKLAREIESQKSNNIHEQIERGQLPETELDEEILHSTVVRSETTESSENGKSTYQTPHQRKSNKPIKQLTAKNDTVDTKPAVDSSAAVQTPTPVPPPTTATPATTTESTKPATTPSKSPEPTPQPIEQKTSKSPLPHDKSSQTKAITTTPAVPSTAQSSDALTVEPIAKQIEQLTVHEPTPQQGTTHPTEQQPTQSTETTAQTTDHTTSDTTQSTETKKPFKFNTKAKEFVFGGETTTSTTTPQQPVVPTQYDPNMYIQPDLQLYLQQQQAGALPIDPLAQQYLLQRQASNTPAAPYIPSQYNTPLIPPTNTPYYNIPAQLPQFYGTVPPQYLQQAYAAGMQYVQLPYNPVQYNPTYVPMPISMNIPQQQQYTPNPQRGRRGRGGHQQYQQ